MTTAADLLSLAWQHHQAGALAEAEGLYRQIVAADPQHADAWHRLGVAVYQQGRHREAIGLIDRAIALVPHDPAMYCHRGAAEGSAGELAAAVASFQQALSIQPADPQAWFNLGAALTQLGQIDQAVAAYQRALQSKPDFVQAWFNLGNIYREAGRTAEAIDAYRQALRIWPDYAEAYNNLGSLLQRLGQLDEAAAMLRQALRCQPNYPRAQSNLGVVLTEVQQFDDAVALLQQAIAAEPDFAEAHSNLAVARMHQGRLDEALASVERAIQLQPDAPEARKNRAVIWLFQGDFARGWPEFEWRWKSHDYPRNPHPEPYWNGEPLAEGTLLLHAEQGLGDAIQFVRFVGPASRRAGRTILTCQPPLARLLEGCAPGVEVVALGAELPKCTAQASLMSLPALLAMDPRDAAVRPPYLHPAPELVELWRRELAGYQGLKVGIAWQGNAQFRGDRFRSVRLEEFLPFAPVHGITLISLQKGYGSEQVGELNGRLDVVDLAPQLDNQRGAFVDTAAVMANLDLVITTDTAAAHLAGALGVPVWVALAHVPEWRWLLARDDSPWYPSMRLFRQTSPGEWPGVFQRMSSELSNLAASRR